MTRKSISRAIIVAIVLVVVVPATVGSSVTATASSDSLRFSSGPITAERGDIAAISLQAPSEQPTLITIKAATTQYELQTAIVDYNGDGKVTLLLNTHLAGRVSNPRTTISALGDDRLKYAVQPTAIRSQPLPAGRYNVIASNLETSIAAPLRLNNGSVSDGTIHTASSRVATGSSVSSFSAFRNEVVRGDVAVAQFSVSGIGALIRDQPGRNVIYPADSMPGERTTHLVRIRPEQNLTLRQMTIDYNAGDGGIPRNVLASNIKSPTVLGVDGNRDGIIEQHSQREIDTPSISARTDGRIRIRMATPVPLNDSEALYLRIPMSNPSIEGSDTVQLTFNGDRSITGKVTYGTPGAGTLGYGIDLQFQVENRTVVNPLAGTNIRYDNVSNTLTVTKPTSSLPTDHTATFELRQLRAYPYGNRSAASASFTIAEPQAYIQTPEEGSVLPTRDVQVLATTNLAPGHQVQIGLMFGQGLGGGSILTNVDSRQRIKQIVTIPSPVATTNVTIQVRYNNTVISRNVTIKYIRQERRRAVNYALRYSRQLEYSPQLIL